MVVLTINAPSNNYTVYFDQPIAKPNYIRLLNCSLYNSWYNLKESAGVEISPKKKKKINFPPGHYTIKNFADRIEKKSDGDLLTKINTFRGILHIDNQSDGNVIFGRNFASFMDYSSDGPEYSYIKKLNSPTTYFIHCDLIDKENNLFSGRPSSILASFDIKGDSFERVLYLPDSQHVLRETSTDNFVKSLNISVRDENGNLFYFNGMPLTFVLEIN